MIKTQYINLDMIPSGVLPVLYCSQYDIGRPLGMVVYNRGEAVNLSTYTCTIEATRTDGTAITAAVTTDGNIGAFVTTATMTNQADKYPAKLVLFDSNSRRVASLAFVMVVTPKTMDENAESIEEDRSLYQQYTEAVQTLIAEIREDIEDVRTDLASEVTNREKADKLQDQAIALSGGEVGMYCDYIEERYADSDGGLHGAYAFAGPDFYATYNIIQGGDYDSGRLCFVIALADSSLENAILVALSADGQYSVLRRSAPLPLGHANDIAYCPVDNMLYVATGDSGQYAGKVVKVNATTLAYDSAIDLGGEVWQISYDRDNNVFYTSNGNTLSKWTSSFTLIESTPLTYSYVGNGYGIVKQCSFVYDGVFYTQSFTQRIADGSFDGIYINSFDKDGKAQSMYKWRPPESSSEPECICVIGNNGYIFSGHVITRVDVLALDKSTFVAPTTNYYDGAIYIPNQADLDTYLAPGKYYCSSATNAATLANCPQTYSGFTMDVRTVIANQIAQEMTCANMIRFARYYNRATHAWTDWVRTAATAVTELEQITVDVPTATNTLLKTYVIPPKQTLMITVTPEFAENATGLRMLQVFGYWLFTIQAVSGDTTRCTGAITLYNNSNNPRNVAVYLRQTSGSTLSCRCTVTTLFL